MPNISKCICGYESENRKSLGSHKIHCQEWGKRLESLAMDASTVSLIKKLGPVRAANELDANVSSLRRLMKDRGTYPNDMKRIGQLRKHRNEAAHHNTIAPHKVQERAMLPSTINANSEQIISAITWMGNELNRLQFENMSLNLANTKLRKAVDEQRSQMVVLQNPGGERSLVGSMS